MEEGALEEVNEFLLPGEVDGQDHDECVWLGDEGGEDLIGEVDGVVGVIGGVEVQQDIIYFA